jgi:hypothetical protein
LYMYFNLMNIYVLWPYNNQKMYGLVHPNMNLKLLLALARILTTNPSPNTKDKTYHYTCRAENYRRPWLDLSYLSGHK